MKRIYLNAEIKYASLLFLAIRETLVSFLLSTLNRNANVNHQMIKRILLGVLLGRGGRKEEVIIPELGCSLHIVQSWLLGGFFPP